MSDAATSDAARPDFNRVQSHSEATLSTDNTAPAPVATQASTSDSDTVGDRSIAAPQGSKQQPAVAEPGHPCSPVDAQQQSSQQPTAVEQGPYCAPSDAQQQSSRQQSNQQPSAAQPVSAGLSAQSPQAAASAREKPQPSGNDVQSLRGTDVHAADHDGHAADTARLAVPSSPMLASLKSSATQSTASESDLTPAVTQGQNSETPAAPQHAAKSRTDSKVSMSVHKSLAFTPAGGGPDIRRPILEESLAQGAKSKSPELPKADIATMIKVKFAELMASKQHTPNEAAVLAVQHVSAIQQT